MKPIEIGDHVTFGFHNDPKTYNGIVTKWEPEKLTISIDLPDGQTAVITLKQPWPPPDDIDIWQEAQDLNREVHEKHINPKETQ